MDLAMSLDPNQVSPGLLGFIIVCILGVGVWLLCRNMGKHLTKLDAEYKAELAAAEQQQGGAEPGGGATPSKPAKKPATQA